MKKILIIFALLFSVIATAQQYHDKGAKFENATSVGDTISNNTRIPIIDEFGLVNYYVDVADLLALNPAPVLEWGNITGTLSNQTDLQGALNDKADQSDLTAHTSNGNIHFTQSAISITESQVSDLKDYLRGDINDTNGANKLTLGSLEVTGQTILQNGLNMSSVPVGTSDNILTLNQTTGDVEQRVFSLGDIDIANAAGTNQFPIGLGDQLRFEGSGDTSISFDGVTNTINITSIPGSGTGGSVTSFNGRTGGVVSEAGDYSTAMVNELTNLYFTEPRVRATPLTGLTVTNTPISSTNTFIQALGRLQGQVNDRYTKSESDGRFIDFTSTQTISGQKTFTNAFGITLSAPSPRLDLNDTDSGVDEKNIRLLNNTGIFDIRLQNDANDAFTNPFRIFRSGTTATEIELNSPMIDVNGNLDVDGTGKFKSGVGETNLLGKYLRVEVASDFQIDHPIIEVWRSRANGWLQDGDEIGALAFRGKPPYSNGAGAGINVFADEDWNSTSEGTELRVFTTENGTNVKRTHAVFQSSGKTAFGNNVMIGSFLSPFYPLEVVSEGVGIAHMNSLRELRVYTSLANDHSKLTMNNGSNVSRVVLNTFGTSYFNGGNVAIGSTTASEKLDVTGNIASTGNVYGDILIGRGDSGDNLRVFGTSTGGANVAYASFYESNGSNRQGYVGFPNTTDSNLIIYNDIGTNSLILNASGGENGLQYNGGFGDRTVYHSGNLTLSTLGGVPTSRTITAGDGLVGGGNLSGNITLDVVGSGGITTTGNAITLTPIAAGSTSFGALQYQGTSRSAGKLYGGSTNPISTTRLNYDGHLYATTMYAGNFVLTSDRRAKTKIKPIDLQPLNIEWKQYELKNHKGEIRYGVVAQDLEAKGYKQFVSEDSQGRKSVKYFDLLVAKIAELEDRIKELEHKLQQ